MKLLSISAHNYRIHRDVEVQFDTARTVVGGPNESGKSTLMDAAHRALFMRYKTGGDAQAQLLSNSGGQPQVTVAFEVGGKRFSISKRFSGQTGTATLTQESGETLKNDAAEARLAELLGVEAASGKALRAQWAHLWVWQGDAFADPTECTNAQATSLLEQFQSSGAAVVQQSSLDGKVAARFEAMWDEYFTKSGDIRKTSTLWKAIERHERSQQERALAEGALTKLLSAATALEAAEQILAGLAESLAALESDRKAVVERRASLTALRATEQIQRVQVASARESMENAQALESRIVDLRSVVAHLGASLAPLEAQTTQLVEQEQHARQRELEANSAVADTERKVRELQHSTVIAELFERRFKRFEDRSGIDARAAEIARLEVERKGILEKRAGLPDVTAEHLQRLVDANQALAMADATLRAMAAGVEVLSSTISVRLNGEVIEQGSRQIVTSDSLLDVGGTAQIRVTPGGGSSLHEAQNSKESARRALAAELDAIGVPTVDAARSAREQIVAHEAALQKLEVRLAECGTSTIADDQERLRQDLATLDGELARRMNLGGERPTPVDLADASDRHRMLVQSLNDLEVKQRSELEFRRETTESLQVAAQQRSDHDSMLQQQKAELNARRSEIDGLLGAHGNDDVRMQALIAKKEVAATRAQQLAASEADIAALQPELLDADEERVTRALASLAQQRAANEEIRLLSRQTLAQDGSRDPHAELALAVAVEREALEARERAELHANAIDLLNQHFDNERESVASQFAAPLREKVSTYLRCLFGPQSTVQLNFDGDSLSGLGLERRGDVNDAFRFDALSGGAREQVAAALRLGVAEVLAAGHDGALPVVFDDAFAYSDPQRLEGLQRMLDLAARRGLQVIVLTCNPRDYDRLGAHMVSLNTPVGPRISGDESESTESAPDIVTRSEPTVRSALPDDADACFLKCLEEAGGKCGSGSLRDTLGWSAGVFDLVKQRLHDSGKIVIGRGRGGSIMLVR